MSYYKTYITMLLYYVILCRYPLSLNKPVYIILDLTLFDFCTSQFWWNYISKACH